jgi:hypothetical protein
MQTRTERATQCLAITAVGVIGLFGTVTVASAQAPPQTEAVWCGNSATSDWACARHGVSWLGNEALSIRTPQRLTRTGLVVATAAGSSARVSLRREAHCTVGTGKAASKVVARPGSGVLLRQVSGDTSCGTPTRSGIELCSEIGCNIELESEGVMLSSVLTEEATASDYLHEDFVHHRVRVISCSGFISVSSPGGSASGGATGPNRYVIEIDDYTYLKESETTVESPTGVTITAEGEAGAGSKIVQSVELPGRGPCKAQYIREEERQLRSLPSRSRGSQLSAAERRREEPDRGQASRRGRRGRLGLPT